MNSTRRSPSPGSQRAVVFAVFLATILVLGRDAASAHHPSRALEKGIAPGLRGGLVVPTGRYETEESFSVTDVVGSSDGSGSIDVITHSTRASIRRQFRVLPDRLVIRGGVDHRFHGQDEIPLKENHARGGGDQGARSISRESSGGWHELGVELGLGARLSTRLSCAVRVRVPVWQRVGGVQRVETVSSRASCSMRVGL